LGAAFPLRPGRLIPCTETDENQKDNQQATHYGRSGA
jgi:hypothetical protein